jgi:hypothetical protein
MANEKPHSADSFGLQRDSFRNADFLAHGCGLVWARVHAAGAP